MTERCKAIKSLRSCQRNSRILLSERIIKVARRRLRGGVRVTQLIDKSVRAARGCEARQTNARVYVHTHIRARRRFCFRKAQKNRAQSRGP